MRWQREHATAVGRQARAQNNQWWEHDTNQQETLSDL